MIFLVYLLLFSTCYYSAMLLWFTIGNVFFNNKTITNQTKPVSIIIAIRNGEIALPSLLIDLKSQNYPGDIEYILVDDESNDSTKKIIQEIAKKDNRFIYQSSINGDSILNHKKRALDAGIKTASYEWLLFTDVDCKLKSSWVSSMAKYFSKKNDYIIGFSEVVPTNNLVTRFQALDFLMLMLSARGSTGMGHPWASSGQNQAYRKSLFNKVGGFRQIAAHLQGDDSLFLQICRKYANPNIVFVDDYECQTNARQETSWISFFKQRIRWAGDAKIVWKFNLPFFISMFPTLLVPILMVITLIVSLLNTDYYILFIQFILIHFFIEFLLYFIGSIQISKPISFLNFSLWFLIHIPYIIITGISSLFIKQLNWKGR